MKIPTLKIPYMLDPVTNKPSITIIFPYFTFVLAFISTVMFHFRPELATPCYTSIVFWFVATILYLLRKLTKVKLDLDDKSIELDSGDSPEEPILLKGSAKIDNPDA